MFVEQAVPGRSMDQLSAEELDTRGAWNAL
jgi:hypothetical protein